MAQASRPPQVALLWPASGSAQLPLAMGVSRAACWCAGSPARITTVVPIGCAVGRARAGAAVRRSPSAPCISGARRRSEPALSCARIAGPSHRGGPPAPRGCAGPGVTGLCAATQTPSARHHCGCSLGQAWHTAQGPGAGGARADRYRARQSRARLPHPQRQRSSYCTLLHPASGTLSSGRTLQTRMGPGEPDLAATATRGHDTPRPEP